MSCLTLLAPASHMQGEVHVFQVLHEVQAPSVVQLSRRKCTLPQHVAT